MNNDIIFNNLKKCSDSFGILKKEFIGLEYDIAINSVVIYSENNTINSNKLILKK
jgi:hypothetical protein